MGKLKMILLSACAAVITMSTVVGYAYSDDAFAKVAMHRTNGFYTVITDTEGDTHTYSGIIDASKLEDYDGVEYIAAYEVLENGDSVIRVAFNDIVTKSAVLIGEEGKPIVNGYYSAEFALSEKENTKVFITGLSESNLKIVQDKLISAKLENSGFSMESLDFIDAEKTNMPNDGDNELCWAASASNILHYTGWGEQTGFYSADDLLDLYRDSFDDVPSHTFFGIEWFLNGTYQPQNWDGWAKVKQYERKNADGVLEAGSGNYFKEYSSASVSKYIEVESNHKAMSDIADGLRTGSGMGVSLGWIDDAGNRNGGHSISAWGYIFDTDFAKTDSEYYKAIIVSDSDSNMPVDSNRRVAPNKLVVLNMTPYQANGYDSWKFDGYGGVLEGFTELIPYSSELEKETDSRATLNKFSYSDLEVDSVYASNDALDNRAKISMFSVGDRIFLTPGFSNYGVDLDETFEYDVTVMKSDVSDIVWGPLTYSYTGKIAAYGMSESAKTESAVIEGLSAGKYKAVVTIKPRDSFTEAYYYNNTCTYDFTVLDKVYDLSKVTFEASVGAFQGGTADVTLNYQGLETLDIPQNTEYSLLQSYENNGVWSSWTQADIDEELPAGKASLQQSLTKPPVKCRIHARGDKVKFRLSLQADDESIPPINLYSDEYGLHYLKLGIVADETNIGVYTPLQRGDTALKTGEKIAFRVKNMSTDPNGEAIPCCVIVYAQKGEEQIELFKKEGISLGYGESTEVLSFDQWKAALSGKYEITAVLEAEDETEFVSDTLYLGSLSVEEQPSLKVTTENDIVDPYDDVVSLREAVAYWKECAGADDWITFDENVSLMILQSPIVIEDAVKVKGRITNMGSNVILYGQGKTQLLRINEGGSLEAEALNLNSGYSKEYGGAIENRGGNVYLKNSIVVYSTSGSAGGGIYSDSGSVKLVNCAFKRDSSGYGGAIGIDGGAVLDMLNCILF